VKLPEPLTLAQLALVALVALVVLVALRLIETSQLVHVSNIHQLISK